MGKKRRAILQGCIFFSLLAHAGAITIIQKHSLWFYSGSKNTTIAKAASTSVKKQDAILKEAFTHKGVGGKGSCLPQKNPLREVEEDMPFATKPLKAQDPMEALQQNLLSKLQEMSTDHLLISSEIHPDGSSFPISTDPHNHLLANLRYPYSLSTQKDEPLFKPANIQETLPELILIKNPLPVAQKEAGQEKAEAFSPDAKFDISKLLVQEEMPEVESSDAEVTFDQPHLQMPTLGDLATASVGENFDIDLVFMPKKGEGYIFALTLIPRPESTFPRLNQNFYFIIDKSNAIQRSRLKTTLNAVYKSLSSLQDGDTFNILAYDGKFERLSSENLRFTKESKYVTREFLNSLQLGSFFSSADPYKPLSALLYDQIDTDELTTVILLTNGEGLANQNKQSYFVNTWTTENSGRMSLYAVSMDNDKNLPILDTLTSLNKGRLYTSPTMPGIKRRLLKLVKTIRYPIAKDVACSVIVRSPNNSVKVYPSFQQMPALYSDQPFVIIGSIDNLDDFILFIQGKQKDSWLHIKKNISFLNAKKGDANLEMQWALQKSYQLYEQYFRDGDTRHLQEAGNILQDHHLPTVF